MKTFAVGLNVFSKAIYSLHLQNHIRLSENILALFYWACCAHYTQILCSSNLVLIIQLIKPELHLDTLKGLSKCGSAGNSLICAVMCSTATLLSVKAAATHPPRFFLISASFFLTARTGQRQQAAFDVPLGRMCRTTYSKAFFLSHRRFKRGTLWENKLWAAFPLRQPHNSLPVCGRASRRPPRLARKISPHLLTHTKNGIGWLPEVTHALTFTVYSV